MNARLPHPIPYQGSKRNLAILIGRYVPKRIDTWYEPFAGSAAMTIWAAHRRSAERYVIGESLEPIAELWRAILNDPKDTAFFQQHLQGGDSSFILAVSYDLFSKSAHARINEFCHKGQF